MPNSSQNNMIGYTGTLHNGVLLSASDHPLDLLMNECMKNQKLLMEIIKQYLK